MGRESQRAWVPTLLPEEVCERGSEGREPDGKAGGERGLREVLGNEGLAETTAALEEDVFAAVDEVELDETLDEGAIDLLGVFPFESVEGLERAKAGKPSPAGEVDGNACPLLKICELLEGLGGTEATLVHMREKGGKSLVIHTKTEGPKSFAEIVVTHRSPPGRAG